LFWSKLEYQLSLQPSPIITELKESITNHDRQLETLVSTIEMNITSLQTEIEAVRRSTVVLDTELERIGSAYESQSELLDDFIANVSQMLSGTFHYWALTSRGRLLIRYPQSRRVRRFVNNVWNI
jgi:hypothetical protein